MSTYKKVNKVEYHNDLIFRLLLQLLLQLQLLPVCVHTHARMHAHTHACMHTHTKLPIILLYAHNDSSYSSVHIFGYKN